jgi:hypothetical protein
VAALTERYQLAYTFVHTRLFKALHSGWRFRHHAFMLHEIERELHQTLRYTTEWATGTAAGQGAFAQIWEMGARASGEALIAQGVVDVTSWYVLPRDAIWVVEQNLLHSLSGALVTARGRAQAWTEVAAALSEAGRSLDAALPPLIGRRIDDAFRRAGLETISRKLTEGMTIKQTRQVLLDELNTSGLTSFTDQAGRRWQLPHYAGMVARTTSREAYTSGTVAVVQRAGYDLVQATTHFPTCDICASRQGRVYSLSGTSPDYPALSESGEHFPWHPNCGHVLTPFIESYTSEEERARLKELSGRPFDEDPRGAREKAAYDRSQALNRLQNEKRKLLAERANGIHADANIVKWDQERRAIDTTPERRKALGEMIANARDRQEQNRKDRLRTINEEIRRLNRQEREGRKGRR